MIRRELIRPQCFLDDILPLVDGGIGKVEDDVGAIEETATRRLGTAEGVATLLDAILTHEAGLLDTAESSTACFSRSAR